MKCKRLGALFLALALVFCVSAPALPAGGLATAAGAIPARDANDQYFGSQLTADKPLGAQARAFYEAMVAMLQNGRLLSGGEQEVDVSGADAKELGRAMSTARDAFYMDYPDLFYVNFNNFAVKQGADGKVSIVPGSRGTGYLLTGLTGELVSSMTASYDAVLAGIVGEARAAAPRSGESPQAAQVRTVHDALTRRIAYTLDDKCGTANLPFIRTAYGVVTGQGVCEAYSRAFKSAMDELDIPCILVEGAFRHSAEVVESHMWAQVKVGEFWYGVDVTMDDPDGSGDIYTDYLLAGSGIMDKQHAPSTVMSAAGYEFQYHSLVLDSYYTSTVHNSNGLTVRLDAAGTMDGEDGGGSGVFYVSYNQKSSTRAAEEDGRYIVARYLTTDQQGDWVTTDWCYLNTEQFPMLKAKETDTETALPLPHVRYVEFGVTDQKPYQMSDEEKAKVDGKNEELKEKLYASQFYTGDPSLLLATSGMQENPNGTYEAPPYIKKASPSQTNTLNVGQTYQVTLQFDQKLEYTAPEAPQLDCKLDVYTFINGKRQSENDRIKKEQVMSTPVLSDDGYTVTFTFTPGKEWALDTVFYTFQLTGVANSSGKAPNDLTYLVSHPCEAYAYQSQGYDWNVYGKPQLLDDPSALDTTKWETKDGQEIADALKHRMTLVVTTPTDGMTDTMENELEKKGISKKDIVETYSINLTLCRAQVIRTGQAVRVMLGFPPGFSYGSLREGTVFKAYHYDKNEQGVITGVKEIPCIVTELGLLILCDSFSPFAIVADNTPSSLDPEGNTLVVNCGEGGSVAVSGAAAKEATAPNLYKLSGTADCEITPAEGYAIESVSLDGTPRQVTNGQSMTVSVPGGKSAALAVTFAPTKAALQTTEETALAAFTAQKPAAAAISGLPAQQQLPAGGSVTLKAALNGATSNCLLQWYKGTDLLPGQTGSELSVGEAGEYTLKVTNFSGPFSAETAAVCKVTAAGVSAPAPQAEPAPAGSNNTGSNNSSNNTGSGTGSSTGQQANSTPAAPPAPAPAPAASAAPKTAATPAPTPATLGKGGPEPTPAPAATPAAALTGTPAPTVPPADEPAGEPAAAPQATAAPAPQGEQKGGIPPLAVAGIAAAGLAVAGGLVWLFLPRRRHYK